ncbi:MAG TPA: sulfite exporter TauE/SafE family protein [Mesorhizobium sp.]|jgi:hypothetical protein|nr:sulfite exporter TauE/SafE family protein [Mesorhizobium sp.]
MSLAFPQPDLPFALLCLTVVIAGVARGLSGFGTGLVVAPVAAALYGPQVAVPMLVVLDSLPTIPMTLPAMRVARWSEVLPVLLGLALFLPAGVFILSHAEAGLLRWTISIAVLASAAILATGWRYRGPRDPSVSFGVGGFAGLLSGIASIPGPPVIFYWMASDMGAAIVRANLLTLFLLSECLSIVSFWVAGLFDGEVVGLGLAAIPPYFAGLLAGARLHGMATEATFRRLTLGLVVLSGLLALPPAGEALRRALGQI